MMNKTIKKRWIKALRSGKYKQGRAALCQERKGVCSFCCLGVLFDTESEGSWVKPYEQSPHWFAVDEGGRYTEYSSLYGNNTIDFGNSLYVSKGEIDDFPLAKKAGLSELNLLDLMDMNDCGSTFEDIADYIEREL